mmetsp:Transcript_16725/g.23255  ORF Transcript_16725/g.23255 Transcript_16725/m.23255 type:complete len:291 (+) Transcript_16725:51-923(+)
MFCRTISCRASRSYQKPVSISTRKFSTKTESLQGKRAIITGSTSGIGLGIAQTLASKGCNIVLNGFGNPRDIDALCSEINTKYKIKVEYHPADMKKAAEIRDMVQFTNTKLGGVDILINNAGIQFVSPVESFPDEKWDDIIAINLSAVFHATKAAIPIMKNQRWGRIVNISSVHGLVASVNKSAYVASKHAVVGFTKTIALETAGSGITANCVNPGWVRTPLVEKQIEARAKEKGLSVEKAAEDLLSEKQPSKQFVTLEQLGETVAFLCSPHAAQITGISVPVDGGWTSQ